MATPLREAILNLRDAITDLALQADYLRDTMAPRDIVAVADDVLEGELGQKMAGIRELAAELRASMLTARGENPDTKGLV